MQTENRFFEDMARMMNGAAGTLAGVGREAQAAMRERMKEFAGGLDFVGREEFEAVKAMAAAARDEADTLRARIEALEARGGSAPAAGGGATFPTGAAGEGI